MALMPTNTTADMNEAIDVAVEVTNPKAIILPEERLKKVNGINSELESILDNLIVYNNKLSRTNAFRKSRSTLINMNKE